MNSAYSISPTLELPVLGPETRRRLLRTLTVYACLLTIGAALVYLAETSGLRALG